MLACAMFPFSQVNSQCSASTNQNGFEYSVDIDLSIVDVIFTQTGDACNANIVVGYDIIIDIVEALPWWNEQLFTLQGNLTCNGSSGSSFFNLPNAGGPGTVTSETFTFDMTNCSAVVLDCPITLVIQGPELNFNGTCGSLMQNPALPVVLSEFSYKNLDREGIELNWVTESEIDFSHFEIELSKENRSWEMIKSVNSYGNVYGSDYKSLIPKSPFDRYARLKIVDFNGTYEYSDILKLPAESGSELSVFPNPASELLNINNGTIVNSRAMNTAGQTFLLSTINQSQIDIRSLNPGFYFLYVELENGKTEILKFLKS